MTRIFTATGHRPNKLGGYSPKILERLTDLAIAAFTKHQPDKVISGGALGWDTAIALAALELNIPLIVAVPFRGQESRWNFQDQFRYQYILDQAEDVIVVSPGGYSAHKMQVRNIWMVDNADTVLALWNYTMGGTANCIEYAKKQNKRIVNFWTSWEKYRGF